MEYFGETNKLAKILSDERQLTKTYGKDRTSRIKQRLKEFRAAENLSQISHLPPPRLHQLSGERKEQFAVDVAANFRLIFEGYDKNDQLTTHKSEIVTLSIIEIEDYH
ncbi:type II toxin-antitoxin system RelE/ParE family toxin [Lactococcus garvieae]|uniref:type II toxin-antitoxin system RelE/ParE family toxin n=1 Tax=Lactococcus garvieae TaxID=1363 RepID=UPI00385321EF